MDPLAGLLEALLLLLLRPQDVDGKGGGESGQRRAGCREGCRHQSDDEEDPDDLREEVTRSEEGEDLVAALRQLDAHLLSVGVEQHSEHEEEGDDEELEDRADDHISPRLRIALAAKVALHHVLVQPRRRHHGESAGEELLPEVAPVIDVVEEENPRHPALPDRRHYAAEVEPQPLGDEDDREDHRGDEADRLEHIDADDTLHSAEEGVYPDKGDRHQDIEEEGQPQRVKYQQLHRQHDEEDPHRGTEHLGDKEEPRSGLVARHPEAIPQVFIDGEELDAVEERHEDKGDQRLPYDEAERHLQVGHAAAGDHPRDGDKGDTADA